MYEKEKKFLERTILLAGNVLKKYYGAKLSISFKGSPNDILTNADLEANEIVINEIKSHFPGDAIVSEESRPQGDSERKWIIDPIDGTKNFVHGIPYFCTTIAFSDRKEIVAGATFDPLRDELFLSVKNSGSFLNNKPIQVSSETDIRKMVLCIDRSSKYKKDEKQNFLNALDKMYSKISSTRILGSQALSLAHVAAGRIDASIHFSPHIWDIAAGVIIVREAGGKITNCCGRNWDLSHQQVFASNGKNHSKIEQILMSD